ncbi:universal stress protein [Nocardia tengchongensis]|uniref:universal stress protein n=1 Tax=Nocardia tengchongensis TaxID=2055889 RepID=UPI0036BDD5FA
MTRNVLTENRSGHRGTSLPPHGPVLVGVDGSGLSDAAVDKAASLAATTGAPLVLVCAYDGKRRRDITGAADILKNEAYLMHGSAAVDEILRTAGERAAARGVQRIVRRAVPGSLVKALLGVADETGASVLVVADHDAGTRKGRWLGTLSGEIRRHTPTELVVVTDTRETAPVVRRSWYPGRQLTTPPA